METINADSAGGAGLFLGITLLVLAAVMLAGCDARSEAAPAMQAPAVDVATVQATPVTVWGSFTGRVAAPETVELRPRVSGYINKVAFEEGAMVEQGDLLFEIDPRPYQARERAARARLATARSELSLADSEAGRAKQLLSSHAISREEYDRRSAAQANARAQLDEARAALDSARLDLEYTRVTAPITGRVGRAYVTRGNLASSDQTLLTTVVSVDPLYVYFDSNEQTVQQSPDFFQQGKGPAVHIGLAGEPGYPHRGQVDFIDNRLNASTGTLQYRAVVANPAGTFKPGQFARVEIPVAQLSDALLVDQKAVLTDQDRRYVYVVDKDNKVARRDVQPGRRVDDLLVIRDGLKPGDRVVVNGVQKIFGSGMPVVPQDVAMAKPDSSSQLAAMP
ncbi:secretion protein HlyD [Alcanivorax hongdengensis A-11-3]|uniref:Secretion protein HlyD n=1 Tax=Alcanivorax hongdengensis A-11-3 TaxID=1177179 RepID=L0WH79_9GAMM|nr:efflux RND transporter periplasmic adaptor subunit [Alcanivorax hongdengensis]EKF76074.1 secretion protein HlyD [Alcanivorax hongdengensis A-11-3]